MNVLGKENVVGRRVEIIDDMGDTFGTTIHAADAFMESGAESAHFIGTHGYFSNDAQGRLANSRISTVRISDSMALRPSVLANPKVDVVGIAPILAQIIADLSTKPEANIQFHERHTEPNDFRENLGRYVGTMMPQLTPGS